MLKFFLIFSIVFVLLLLIIPLVIYGKPVSDSFQEIMTEGKLVVILIVIYAFLYPVINFVNLKRHLNGTFENNRRFFEDAFKVLGYEKTSETGTTVTFRKRSGISKAFLFWDDEVILNIAENPVIISGMRKMVNRINRLIEQNILRETDQ